MTAHRQGWRAAAALGLAAAVVACGGRAPAPDGPPAPAEGPTATATEVTQQDNRRRRDNNQRPSEAAVATPQPAPTAAPSVETATTPAALAEILVAAERAVRDEQVRGAALAAAGHTQQQAYRRLSLRPRWRAKVIAATPRPLRPAVRRNVAAGAALTSLVTPQRKLPDWRIVRPAPAADLLAHYRRAAAEFGIDWHYLAAIHLVETRMGRIRGVSTAGAQGPMQFMPATWDAYGKGDVNDNGDAIMAAARYLAAHGAPNDMDRALWHYNHSDRYVAAISAYAAVLRGDERAFRGYYHWQVHYMTKDGDVHLPEGYGR